MDCRTIRLNNPQRTAFLGLTPPMQDRKVGKKHIDSFVETKNMISRKTCTLVGSDKGGVGKSLMSQILIAAYDQANCPLKVVEIDNQHTLSAVFKDRVDLSMEATPGTGSDRRTMHMHYARPYEHWAASDSVTDLGANVSTPLLNWMIENEIPHIADEDGIHFRFLSVAIPDDQSLRSAAASIELARRALGADASLHLVLNDTVGLSGFSPYEASAAWMRLMGMRETHGVDIIQIPHCASRIMDWGRARGLTVLQILENGPHVDQICAEAGFNRIERHQEIRSFLNWVVQVQQSLAHLFARPNGGYATAAE